MVARWETLAGLYLVWCLMGLAMATTLYEPAFAAIVQWFARHRDRALLTVTLAGGLASTIFMPLATWLLARLGWRTAVLVLAGVLAIVTIPIHAIVLRPPRPGGGVDDIAATLASNVTLTAALRRLVFWVLAFAFVLGNSPPPR